MQPETATQAQVPAAHRAKRADGDLRQSSLSQVVRHGESTTLQYEFVERAGRLGWPPDRVQAIDDDLGTRGASADHRPGFQWLIAAIGLGHVGRVLSLDASRVARNNSDGYRVMARCAMGGTRMADGEPRYDPRAYHDRLV